MAAVFSNLNNAPIAIGALGGSGTRVVAEILMQAGVYLGDNLNEAHDNLTFTCLLKRPDWYMNSQKKDRIQHLALFGRLMKGEKLTIEERVLYSKAYFSNWNYTLKNKIKAPFKKNKEVEYVAWGWKEPNTHHYIKELNEVFPNVKYVHVLRNGLDMAFSGNVQQLKNFGKNYDVEYPTEKSQIPIAQLEYWLRANSHAISLAQNTFKERFFLLRFEDLCNQPEIIIRDLLKFLNLTVSEETRKHLLTLPKLPSSSGRFKQKDLSIFSAEQVQNVKELGYAIPHKTEAI